MEPKRAGLIEEEFLRLESDVLAYLSFQEALLTDDDVLKQLLMADPIDMPEPYILWRRLRLYSTRAGATPFLLPGSYLDQPYITMRQLEACSSAEEKHFIVTLQKPQI